MIQGHGRTFLETTKFFSKYKGHKHPQVGLAPPGTPSCPPRHLFTIRVPPDLELLGLLKGERGYSAIDYLHEFIILF